MFAPSSCSVGKRNRGAIFKAQIMAENTENNKKFVNSQSSQVGKKILIDLKEPPIQTLL